MRFLPPSRLSSLLAVFGLQLTSQAFPTAPASDILPVPPAATKRVATVQVRVAPDHRDWAYKLGETAHFRIFITADNEPLEVPFTYTIGPDLMPAEKHNGTGTLEGLVVEGKLDQPGFLRCNVEADVAGQHYKGSATAAYAPEQIQPTQENPADFDSFWQAAKGELTATPMEPKLTILPEACTAKVNVYQVSLRVPSPSWGPQARIFGILCEPVAPGSYPALLRVPGAGVRPYTGDLAFAEKGCITLEIGIHGVPVNMAKEIYDVLFGGALREYWNYNLDNRDTYYYRRVIQGCLRSNDFLCSRPGWDGRHLAVAGASQGGMLTIATAALDPRVTCLAATHPAFSDLTGELHGRAGGWPHPFKPNDDGSASRLNTPACIRTSAYYDTVNFARRVKAPGFYCWGYNDEVCPPTSTHAVYNVITAPKELALTLEMGHSYSNEQYAAISAFLCTQLGLK